jgi:hypothetical protein
MMPRHLVFGRHEYAEPLELVGEVEAAHPPTVAEAGVGDDWLELVAFPADAAIWVVRDASHVDGGKGAPA